MATTFSASLSTKTVNILNDNEVRCLFTSQRWFGHHGVINWFPKEEIINFIKSLGEARFLGAGFYPAGITGKKPATLIFEGHEIDYVIPVPKRAEITLEGWSTAREQAYENILASGNGYKIVQSNRCTVSTNLETRQTTYLYTEVEGLKNA